MIGRYSAIHGVYWQPRGQRYKPTARDMEEALRCHVDGQGVHGGVDLSQQQRSGVRHAGASSSHGMAVERQQQQQQQQHLHRYYRERSSGASEVPIQPGWARFKFCRVLEHPFKRLVEKLLMLVSTSRLTLWEDSGPPGLGQSCD